MGERSTVRNVTSRFCCQVTCVRSLYNGAIFIAFDMALAGVWPAKFSLSELKHSRTNQQLAMNTRRNNGGSEPMSQQEMQALRDSFKKDDWVVVQRRKYSRGGAVEHQTIHVGYILEKRETGAAVKFPYKRGTQIEELQYTRLRKMPEGVEPPPKKPNGGLRAVPVAFEQQLAMMLKAEQKLDDVAVPSTNKPSPTVFQVKHRPARKQVDDQKLVHVPATRANDVPGESMIVPKPNTAEVKPVSVVDIGDQHKQVSLSDLLSGLGDDAPLDPEILTWMQMGSGLLETLKTKYERLNAESESHFAEAERLADLAESKAKEAENVKKQLQVAEALSKLASKVAQV